MTEEAKKPITSQKENLFQSRKGQVYLIGIILSTIMLWFGRIDGADWTQALFILSGIYTGGNVWEKVKK